MKSLLSTSLSNLRPVKIVEVGPRDGLQNEKPLTIEQRTNYIEKLVTAGIKNIEFGSFVSPKLKQMQDSASVLKNINKKPNINYIALVANEKYALEAIEAGATELAVFTTISEEFSQKNTRCSVAESMEKIKSIMQISNDNKIPVRGYISCIMGCPYEGYNQDYIIKTATMAYNLVRMGCYEISLGDTIGIGNPVATYYTLKYIKKVVPTNKLAVHFHNTYGRALANIIVALEEGIRVIDSASGGLGGCPFAKGATGNVATEDVIDMLNSMSFKKNAFEHGIDLEKLTEASNYIHEQLGKTSESIVLQAINRTGNIPNYEEY